ncbi:MAG: CBS domain-containing protein [Pseudomonadota bacterium]
MRVEDLLKAKGSAVHIIDPDQLVQDAAQDLAKANVGALVVSRDGRTIDGILSERDIVRGYAKNGRDLSQLHVSDLMTRSVITCCSSDQVSSVAHVMTSKRIRHIPVCIGNELMGMVSIGDVLKSRIDEVQLEANVLRDVALASR